MGAATVTPVPKAKIGTLIVCHPLEVIVMG